MDLLQKYLFVTLDNYLEIKHNKGKKLGWGDADVFKRIT